MHFKILQKSAEVLAFILNKKLVPDMVFNYVFSYL